MSRYEYDKVQEATEDHGGEEEVFEEYLRRRGLKFTSARRQLLNKIFVMHDHFTADQLLDRLKADRMRLSKATVYRTLSVMLDCGLLISHDFGEGARYYEHSHGHAHHEHLFCVACKQIVEFKTEPFEGQLRTVAEDLGFDLLSHSIKIFGLCPDCRTDEGLQARFTTASPRLNG